jgi:hypothetical protein
MTVLEYSHVYTFSKRFIVNENQLGEHGKRVRRRLLELDISDEDFLQRFFERHGDDVESDLKSEETFGPARYEEALQSWIETAEKDHYYYGSERSSRVQEGNIPPKKSRRARKPKDIAGVWERQEALARYLEGVASEEEKIISFRREFLSGRLLSREEALTFLSSPSTIAEGSRTVFKMLRMNPLERILDSNYQMEEGQDDRGLYRKLMWTSGSTKKVRALDVTPSRPIFPGNVVTSDDLRGLRAQGGRVTIFPHPHEENRFVLARQNSVIAHMVDIVERALQGYPISLDRGVWFILTGEFIPEDPVRIRYMTVQHPDFGRTTFTLEVEAWLPPEEVLDQYRHTQSQVLGKTPRSPKRKALNVFEFVNRHKGKSWGELFELWNEQHPNDRFKDRSHLWTSYTRTLHSHLAIPERTP